MADIDELIAEMFGPDDTQVLPVIPEVPDLDSVRAYLDRSAAKRKHGTPSLGDWMAYNERVTRG